MPMDATLFPPGWRNRSIGQTTDSHGAIEHVLRDMAGYGTVVHEIYRYERVPSGYRHEYQRQLEVFYTRRHDFSSHGCPDLTAQLDSADEALRGMCRLHCATGERCAALWHANALASLWCASQLKSHHRPLCAG